MDHPRFIEGRLSTNFIPEEFPQGYKGHVLSVNDKRALIGASLVVFSRILHTQLSLSGQISTFDRHEYHAQQLKELVVSLRDELYRACVTSVAFRGREQQMTVRISAMPALKRKDNKGNDKSNDKKLSKDKDKDKDNKAKEETVVDSTVVELTLTSAFQRGDVVFSISANGNETVVQVVEATDSVSQMTLQYMGTMFDVNVCSMVQHELSQFMPAKAVLDTSRYVVSPMPGQVYSISVKPGDQVVVGQEVCVVEAMKMQNALRAPRSGKVKAVRVAKGKTVTADEILIEFEQEK